MYIDVAAYGTQRFELMFNPCNANIASLCPMNNSIPISAEAIIPVGESDISGIPAIALTIPDFEGNARLRFFSNTSRSEIACYQAVMRNGATFSHPAAVGTTLGGFAVIAVAASFATLIYGVSIPHVRTHYAHSLSVLVVFEVFQSIFFSGVLSLNWPSVLVAFWSNYAWSAGMIHSPHITNSVNKFLGQNLGNNSQVGGAGSTAFNANGGAQQAQQIYGRSMTKLLDYSSYENAKRGEHIASQLYSRATSQTNDTGIGYSWSGSPVKQGLPIPGNWSGFAGELSMVDIPASDAFLTGFIWLLILLTLLILATIGFKWFLEGLAKAKFIKEDRLALFRSHWIGFTGLIVLRTLTVAFSMIMILILYQFSTGGGTGITAIAAIVFIIFFVGFFAIAAYACFFRLRFGKWTSSPDKLRFESKKVMKVVPWYSTIRRSTMEKEAAGAESVTTTSSKSKTGGLPIFRIEYTDNDVGRPSVHDDVTYIKRFGWLTARFRRTRWWFFAYWIIYQFIRACFIGGASQSPSSQVYGLFVIEILALIAVVCINPFEGRRNTALAVWMLSISKVATAGLSIAFLPQFDLARIPAVVVGIIIIIIQGFLTIAVMILVVIGAISSYMSLTRNRETFRPKRWEGLRVKYFQHLEKSSQDLPPPPPPIPEEPKEPYFSVNTVRRAPKIEDEDEDFLPDMDIMEEESAAPPQAVQKASRSRANSMRSMNSIYGSVPYGARVHRASWSSRDFANAGASGSVPDILQDRGLMHGSPFRPDKRSASSNHMRNVSGASMGMGNIAAPGIDTTPISGVDGGVSSMGSRTSLNSNTRPQTPSRAQRERFSAQRMSANNTLEV